MDTDKIPISIKPIKGAVLRTEPAETAALWAQCPYLRPADHGEWLRHFANFEINLTRLQAGWIPAAGNLGWKLELPRFMFEDMQHAHRLKERLDEMPRPESGLTDTEETLARFFTAIGPAEHAASFFRVLHAVVKPALAAAYEEYLLRCDSILDAPVIYTLRGVIAEKRRQRDEARAFFDSAPYYTDDEAKASAYLRHVTTCLAALGSLTPEYRRNAAFPANPIPNPAGPSPALTVHDPELHLTQNGEFPTDKARNPFASTLQEIIYHNATEWQVVGPMCYVLHDVPMMPFEFYVDFTRHIWDECRHAQMGLRRLRELGYSSADFHFPDGGNKPASPEDYLASLTMIGEACSFNRKRGSIVPFLRAGDYRSAMLPEVDCVDEQMHVGYGHKWVPEVYLRVRGERRAIRQIADDTRRRLIENIERLKEASPEERAVILSNLPTFCSTIEFQHLDLDASVLK